MAPGFLRHVVKRSEPLGRVVGVRPGRGNRSRRVVEQRSRRAYSRAPLPGKEQLPKPLPLHDLHAGVTKLQKAGFHPPRRPFRGGSPAGPPPWGGSPLGGGGPALETEPRGSTNRRLNRRGGPGAKVYPRGPVLPRPGRAVIMGKETPPFARETAMRTVACVL